ncbi:hypothetical protein Tco_1005995 [Tanacetum coccineum]|uniref:Integrase, catalytic region, zinc finger, CCHC-type, peptidase aspartic, catalytic n=1 Tax=Tanacetum coccineum TaxID=301880 RepID=A0ABQ5FGR2_9ASTR
MSSVTSLDAPAFESVFEIGHLKEQLQGRGNTIREMKAKISRFKKKHSKADLILDFKALHSQNKDLNAKVNALQDLNERFRVENKKVKQHYKELYDSIKLTRAKTIEKTTSLLTEIETLKAQIKGKMKCVTMLDPMKPKVLAPGMYVIDVEPIPPQNRNNKEVHLEYLKYLKESVGTLREIVEEARVEKPLDSSLAYACLYTKHSQELLEYVIGTYPKDFNKRYRKIAILPLNRKKRVTFIEPVKYATAASGSKPTSNTKKDKTLPAKSDMKKVEAHFRNNKSSVKQKNRVDSSISFRGCSKHMTGDRSQLRNFVKKFIGTVRFRNDHFGAIMGYGDYFQMEECHFLLTDQVDWVNPEGHRVMPDVSKPLPLGGPPGSKERRSALSISKLKAINYPDFRLEELVTSLWIKSEREYDISAAHVRSHMRILSVVSLKTISRYGYTYLKEIVLRRADYKEYKI